MYVLFFGSRFIKRFIKKVGFEMGEGAPKCLSKKISSNILILSQSLLKEQF
jgi:hypothetical protein